MAQENQAITIVVKLKRDLNNNSFISGIVDSNTDEASLWLRQEKSGIQLRTSYAWSDIAAAKVGNDVLDAAALKNFAMKSKSAPKSFHQIAPATIIQQVSLQQSNSTVIPFDDRVQSLSIHAEVANWDNNPEMDGLRVFVVPCNRNGEMVKVNGEITLTLTGQFQPVAVTHERRTTPGFRELVTVSHLVREADFARGPAVYQIPFDQYVPEKEFNLVPLGIVTARLGVNTQGAFTASESDVVLRWPSYLRDQLQYQTDRRSLPRER